MKITEKEKIEKIEIMGDNSIPLDVRKRAYKELVDLQQNPDNNFDPLTFDPMKDVENYEVVRRHREAPPARLETMGMFPKKILGGQLIGEYESKQDLYLTMAHYINNLLDRIEYLEAEITKLKVK